MRSVIKMAFRINFTFKLMLVLFFLVSLLSVNLQGHINNIGGTMLPSLSNVEAAATNEHGTSIAAPGKTIDVSGIGTVQLTFTNSTGYQAKTMLDENLELDISVNFKPHGKYVPSADEVGMMQQSGVPILNLQRTVFTPPDGRTMTWQWNFLVPTAELSSSSPTASRTAASLNSNSPLFSGDSSSIILVADSHDPAKPVFDVKKAIDTAEGTTIEILKVSDAYKGTAAEGFHTWFKKFSNLADFFKYGWDYGKYAGQISSLKNCMAKSPIQWYSEGAKKRTEGEINYSESSIMASITMKVITSAVWKLFSWEDPTPYLPLTKVGLSKFADAQIDPWINYEMNYIKRLTGCSGEASNPHYTPTDAECQLVAMKTLDPATFANAKGWREIKMVNGCVCQYLLEKDLSNFADNRIFCTSAKKFPPLKQFVKYPHDAKSTAADNQQLLQKLPQSLQQHSLSITPPMNLTQSSSHFSNPKIAIGGNGNVYTAWQDVTNHTLLFSRSTDGGATFSEPLKIIATADTNDVEQPQLDTQDNNVYVTWGDSRLGGVGFSRSTDGGATFSNETLLSKPNNPAGTTSDCYGTHECASKIVTFGKSQVYILLFNGYGTDKTRVLLTRSTNGGATFSEPTIITANRTSTFGSNGPQMAISENGTIYVAWIESGKDTFSDKVLFKRSTDGGATFSGDPRILFEPAGCSGNLVMSASKSNVYAACVFDGLQYTESTDYGTSFSDNVTLTNREDEHRSKLTITSPYIFSTLNDTYIGYTLARDSQVEGAYILRTPDNQTKFSSPVQIASNTQHWGTVYDETTISSLKAAGNNVYVMLRGRDGGSFNESFLFTASFDKGSTFQPFTWLGHYDVTGKGQSGIAISSDNNSVHLVWSTAGDSSRAFGSNPPQYSRVSITTAVKQMQHLLSTTPAMNLTSSNNRLDTPAIAVGENGNIYTAWQNLTDNQLLFSRSTDGGATFSEPTRLTEESRTREGDKIQLATQANNVYITWGDDQSTGVGYIRSTDGGATFSNETVFEKSSWDISGSKLFTVGEHNVYILLFGLNTADKRVLLTHSTDGGATFSEPTVVTANQTKTDSFQEPQMAISENGTIYVAWFKNDKVFFKRSTDGGATFSGEPIPLFEPTGCSNRLTLSATENNVYAVCIFTNKELTEGSIPGTHGVLDYSVLLYTGSTDYGVTFSDTSSLTSKQDSDNGDIGLTAEHPSISSTGGVAYVGYTIRKNFVMIITISDNQTRFFEPVLASNNTRISDSFIAALKTDGNSVYVLYTEEPNDQAIGESLLFTSSSDKGAAFHSPITISQNNTGLSTDGSDIAISHDDNNKAHLIWLTSNRNFINTLQYSQVSDDTDRSITKSVPNGELINKEIKGKDTSRPNDTDDPLGINPTASWPLQQPSQEQQHQDGNSKSNKTSVNSTANAEQLPDQNQQQPSQQQQPEQSLDEKSPSQEEQQNKSSSTVQSTDAQLLLNKGNELYAKGDFQGALAEYENAVHGDPKSSEAWNGKGAALNGLGRYQEAIQALDKALDIAPDYAVAWNNKGFALENLERHEEAIQAYNKALQIDPNFAIAWDNKAEALIKQGTYFEALKAADKALDIDPTDAIFWNDKGVALNGMGKYQEAIQAYDLALKINPDYAMTWNNKGISLDNLGKHEEAIQAYNKALQIDPNFRMAKENRDRTSGTPSAPQ